MFSKVIELIEKLEFETAQKSLLALLTSSDEQTVAKSNYLLGYINTCRKFDNRNENVARRYLYANLISDYPQPYAYILYARTEEDSNVALNYLKKGIQNFPGELKLYEELLQLSPDKNSVVQLIMDCGFSDAQLLGKVISYLVSAQQWNTINRFVFRIQNDNVLDRTTNTYLDLISAYAYLFCDTPDFEKAQDILKKVIDDDIDNDYAYAHYLGMIYAYIKQDKLDKAIAYFDRLPVSNSIFDFDDGPVPLGIHISFCSLYQIIFNEIIKAFLKDSVRKNKAGALYALYLYYPSEYMDVCRYKKTDALALTRYLKTEFNTKIAVALYNMRCHFEQFEEAYEVVWAFLKQHQNLEENGVFFSEIMDYASDEDMMGIVERTVKHLRDGEFDNKTFLSTIFVKLVKKLHKSQHYKDIRRIADYITDSEIIESACAFECAFAYGDKDDQRTAKLYEGLLQREPKNYSAINNLGVLYEHRSDLYRALSCYEQAFTAVPSEKVYQNNVKRIQDLIQQKTEEEILGMSSAISLTSLEEIGYTTNLCKKIFQIRDNELKNILLRDLRECAVAIVAGQDKMATIMCGSIIEALLMQKIKERNILKYDLSEISKNRHVSNYPIDDMGLNELLFVADKEKLLDKNSYHLGHYIRDYRNVVHPAKEIRMKEEVSHDNVLTMWSVLKHLVAELF